MKRLILTSLLFLLLSAVVNVAVAWVCVRGAGRLYWSDTDRETRMLAAPDSEWPAQVPDDWPPPLELTRIESSWLTLVEFRGELWESEGGKTTHVITPDNYRDKIDQEVFTKQYIAEIYLLDSGWPAQALKWDGWRWTYGWSTSRDQQRPGRVRGLDLPVEGPALTTSWFGLPARPISHGFALNTLFYAVVLWLPLAGVRSLRRHLRSKRGCCIRCGYDLRGDLIAGCPECGWRRTARAPAAALAAAHSATTETPRKPFYRSFRLFRGSDSDSIWFGEFSSDELTALVIALLTWIAVFTSLLLMVGADVIAAAFAVVPLWIGIRWLIASRTVRPLLSIARGTVVVHAAICLFLLISGLRELLRMHGWI